MKKTMLILLTFFVIIATGCSSNQMEKLPEGNILNSAKSPDGKYSLETYLCTVKGEVYIRSAVIENETKESRNVYWDEYNDAVDVEWLDNTNVKIEDKTIDVTDEKIYYDYREK